MVSPFVHGQISFAPLETHSFSSYTYSSAVCVGDVNNDGLNDIVMGIRRDTLSIHIRELYVISQDVSGQLLAPVKYSYSTGGIYPTHAICIGDVNNDSLSDVMLECNDSVFIFYQDITGTLNPVQKYYSGVIAGLAGNNIRGIAVGDLNNDGLNDITVNHFDGDSISILFQLISGGFSVVNLASPLPAVAAFNQIDIYDMNNDLLNDIVLCTNSYSPVIVVFYQQANGTFNSFVSVSSNNTIGGNNGIAVGDINNDGLNDVVNAYGGSQPNSYISLFSQNPINNQLSSPQPISSYDAPKIPKIADLNCDGHNEIIVCHEGSRGISIFEQDSLHNYGSYSNMGLGVCNIINNYSFDIGDIDNDNKKDLVIAGYNPNLLIYRNTSTLEGLCCELPLKPNVFSYDSIICLPQSNVVFYSTSSNDSLFWVLTPSIAGSIAQSNGDSCVISVNNFWAGTLSLVCEARNECGARISDSLFIKVENEPIAFLGDDTLLCESDSVTICAQSLYGDYFIWQDSSNDSCLSVSHEGIYFISAINSCGTASDTILFTQVSLPEISLPTDTIICDQNPIIIDASVPGNASYIWSNGSSNSFTEIALPGEYSVSVTDSNGCKSCDTVSITELNSPYSDIIDTYTICAGTELTLNAFNYGSTYVWQDGSTDAQFSVIDSGLYYVTVSNFCGTVSDSTIIKLSDCTDYLELPSAFSPNYDGINDLLIPIGRNVTNVQFMIYDRWGEKVFECNCDLPQNPVISECAWNGTFRGRNLDPGVYMYYLSGNSVLDGRLIQYSGNVSLVR